MHTDRVEYPITSGYIQVVAEGHALPAFWAHPDTGGTFPGLVLIHDRWGLVDSVRRLARRFAETGYYVIAPDLLGGHLPQTPDEAQGRADALAETGSPGLAAALEALRTHHRCNGDIAAVGLGMGGTLALSLAVARDDLKAVVVFNGHLEPYRLSLAAAPTPVLGLYADGVEGMSAERAAELESGPGEAARHRFVVYAGVGRDFFDEHSADHAPAVADEAWGRVLDFLQARLTHPSQPPDIRQKRY